MLDEPEKARESEIKERHRGEMGDEGMIAINGAGWYIEYPVPYICFTVLIAHYFSPIAASLSDMLAVAVEAAKAAGEVSFYCLCISWYRSCKI